MSSLDVSTFQPAVFQNKAYFQHFSDPENEDCFACNSQQMKVRPHLVNSDYTLLSAITQLHDESFVVMPYAWLLYPRKHITSFLDMPDNWSNCVKQAVRLLGLDGTSFNISDNWGSRAGQTAPHGHTWIIGRGWGEDGLLGQNTGLATLLLRIKQMDISA